MKELRGAWRYPVAVADGKGTCSGKITFAQIWPETIAAITSGTQTEGAISGTWPDNTGGITVAISEVGTVPGSTSYTVTLANASTMVTGTEIVSVSIPSYGPVFYTRVASGPVSATSSNPTGGTYTISAGVLTFASGDASRTVHTTYFYSTTGGSADAQIGVQLAQVGLNTALTFSLMLIGTGRNLYNNGTQDFICQLNACLAPSLKFDFKLDDFTMLDLDFDAFVDINGNLATFYMVSP